MSDKQKSKINDEVINYTQYSHNRLISIINKISLQMDTVTVGQSFKVKFQIYYNRFRAYIRWKKGKYYHKSAYSIAFEGLKKNEVIDKIRKLQLIEGDKAINFLISKRGINVFHLTNKSKAKQ